MQVAPRAGNLRLQKRSSWLGEPEAYHLHLRPVLVCELDTLIFVAIGQKVHVSSGESNGHTILAGTQDSLSPTQYIPLWTIRPEKGTSQMLDM